MDNVRDANMQLLGVGMTGLLDTKCNSRRNSGHTPLDLSGQLYQKVSSTNLEEYDETIATDASRDSWGNDLDFLMSCLALSVGLGNVWRFPISALENGGGAFIIAYIVVLVLVGKPLYYMEMVIGQFSGRNSIAVYDMVPLMRGVGCGQVYASALISTYYAAILGIILRYFFASFGAILPWSVCRGEWEESCVDSTRAQPILSNGSNMSEAVAYITGNGSSKPLSSAALYFSKVVLNEISSIDNGIGYPDWKLSLCLGCAWLCIVICLIKGIQSSGKISYFLAIFPYFMMTILLIRAVTLPGAMDGIKMLVYPEWSQLLQPKVWFDAVSQVFFSISVCLSLIITFSSFNRFGHNIYRDAIIVTSMDTFTSILSAIITFGILGNVAHETNIDIRDSKGGAGLAFISYPDAIAKLQWLPSIFSVIFFFMLFLLGMGSNMGLCVCLTTIIRDRFKSLSYWKAIVSVAVVQFSIGLLYMTPGGQPLLDLFSHYGTTIVVYVLAIAELLTVSWMYGVDRLCADVEFMLGRKTGWFMRICWAIITPVLMIAIMVYTFATLEQLTYNGQNYPALAYAIGYTLTVCGIFPLVVIAIVSVLQAKASSLREKLAEALRPLDTWGPNDIALLTRYKEFMAERNANLPTDWWGRLKLNLFGP